MALITTLIDGVMGETDEALLIKTEGIFDDDNERTTWVEYRQTPDGAVVHRSVHVHLKQGNAALSALGGVGG